MTPEGKVKAHVKSILRRYQPDVWYFMPVSGGYGRHGIPDFVCCIKGKFFCIECKAGTGELTELQATTLLQINDAGGVTLVVRSTEDQALLGYLQMVGIKVR